METRLLVYNCLTPHIQDGNRAFPKAPVLVFHFSDCPWVVGFSL